MRTAPNRLGISTSNPYTDIKSASTNFGNAAKKKKPKEYQDLEQPK